MNQPDPESSSDRDELLEQILDNLPVMVFVKDATTLQYVRLNPAGERLTGLDRHGIVGKTDVEIFPPEIAAFFQEKDRRTLAAGEVVEILEEPVKTHKGQRWLHTLKVPIAGADGTPRYLLGISVDITDTRVANEKARRATEAAEASNRELESFAYSVSHDLRAPLRAIDGFSQALLEDEEPRLSTRGKDYLRRVRGAAQRMTGLIDDLLDLSRVGRAELRATPVDLGALAHEVVDELRQLEPTRDVVVSVNGDLVVDGDRTLLGLVIRNLIGNAWKYTGKKPQARIEIVGRRDGGATVVTVVDDGAGFDATASDRLFSPFQRLHKDADFPGNGIGLATIRRIVHRHGGKVTATGAVGVGATFTVTLPTAQVRSP